MSIIITTHYIEEARDAHMVGIMRNGRLLAQEPPGQPPEHGSQPAAFARCYRVKPP